MPPLRNFVLLILFSFFSTTVWSQNGNIKGKVISEDDNRPLASVSVSVKGKKLATQTNNNGEFSISASQGDILEFTYTGYTPQSFPVGTSMDISIVMKTDVTNLGEVVVVGYGTQSRRNISSAIGKLDNTVLKSAPRSNVGTALQGSIAGIRVVNNSGSPGAAPSILLRGYSTISSDVSPLVVVDGIVRSLNDISPDDVASIELLKDAASTAIYGTRATNGVILITTKQGKSGTAQISYKYLRGTNKNRDDYTYLNAKDYIYYNRLGNFNSQRTLTAVNQSRGYGLPTGPGVPAGTGVADFNLFDIRKYDVSNAYLLQNGWDTVGDPYGGTIIFKDHGGEVADLVFRNAYTDDHYINVSGGNDRGKYYASFNYYKETGIIVGSDYKRYSGTINGSYKIKSNLEAGSGATFSTSSQYGVIGGEINTLYRNIGLWPTMNPWLDSAKTIPNPGNGITDGNPLYWLSKNIRGNEINRITGNAYLKYDILKNLYVKLSGNIYLFENLNDGFTKATQTYGQLYTTPQGFNTTRPAFSSFGRTVQATYNGIVNYTKTFKSKHNLDVMVGAESFGQKSLSTQVSGTGAPTDDIPTVNASTVFASGSNFSTKSQFRIISNFSRINYNYDNRYLLTFVHRADGISSLAEKARWGFFPGMSVGWNLHNEAFFKRSSVAKYITSVKPRISYGVNGNASGIGNYDVQGGYGSQGNYNGSLGFLNTLPVNPKLAWEKSTTTDLGLDMGLFHNRVTLIFDYFKRLNSDILQSLVLPGYTGFGGITTNNGELENKGYEFTVNAKILKTNSGITLDASANIAFVKNKITKLPYNGNENNRQGGFQIYDANAGKLIWVTGLQEGQPLGAIYAFKQVSIFQDAAEIAKVANNRYDAVALISGPGLTSGLGKITPGDVNWMDVDKNDTIDSRDQVYIGNINPKFTGGFSTTLSYKGFSLYTRWDFAVGHTLYNDLVTRTLGNYQGTFNYIDWQKKGFSGDNSMKDIPKVYFADQVGAPAGKKNYTRNNNANSVLQSNNSNFYEKGDYLACREVTLSYDFSKPILSKTRVLSQARLFLNMNNLFYITKFTGNSPEPKSNGIFAGNYATPKSFVMGVQVSF